MSNLTAVCLALASTLIVDAKSPTTPFPHFWEHMFGSGRAVLSLREGYRSDLRALKRIADARYVRFHGIFHDELGLYDEDSQGNPVYNFTYVDQIYDGLLANGVRPFVELSFMPAKLSASPPVVHSFWYKPVVSQPKDYQKWADLNATFVRHLIARYGIDEVSQWYFEVWNEPNIDFWAGDPKQETYFKLYDSAAKAIKYIDPRIRVGGPASAQAAWIGDLIEHCTKNSVPLDFVSTHVYGNDSGPNVLNTNDPVPRADMVAWAVRKVYDEVKHSSRPNIPIIWSEYNASYMNEVNITDSAFMGPWLAQNISRCDGLTTEMSLWTFSDVFEEQGVAKRPFYGGYGLIASGGIPKAAYNAVAMLHGLGRERIKTDPQSAIATRRADGSLAIILWNYVEPGTTGATKKIKLELKNISAPSGTIQILDDTHGSALTAYREMGSPAFPSKEETQRLIIASKSPAKQPLKFDATINGTTVTLPPNSLALIEIAQHAEHGRR